MLKDLVLGDEMLTLSINEGAATGFDYFWLRDNARDPESFDSRSHQRELYTAAIDPMIRPKAARLSDDGDALILDWPDLNIEAHYEAGFLADFSSAGDPMRMPEATPWDGRSIDPEAVRLPYATLSGNEGVTPLLETMLAHGFAVLTDCPRDLTAVQTVADSIGYVRQTIFGGLFEFEANENMADSAYTPKELRPIPTAPTAMMRRAFSCCCASAMRPRAVNRSWSTARGLPKGWLPSNRRFMPTSHGSG